MSGRPHVTTLMRYIVQPIFDGDAPPTSSPKGSPGLYRLAYVLAVPGRITAHDAVNFEQLLKSGDSLLQVPPEVAHVRYQAVGPDGDCYTLMVNANPEHRLSDIRLEIRADTFEHAIAFGYDVIAPTLSRWSYLHDVSIAIAAFQVVEVDTHTHLWMMPIVGAVKAFADHDGYSVPDHRLLLSAYREGISSTEPLWRALSLYRAAEGAIQMRNARIAAIARAAGSPMQPSGRVPDDVEALGPANDFGLRDSLRPYVGKRFSDILTNDIRPAIRNAAAHMDLDETVLVQDRWQDLQKVEKLLPALRWIARQIIESELQEQGSVGETAEARGD